MGCQKFPVLTSKDRNPSCENPKNQRDMVKPIKERVANHGQTAALTAQWLSQRRDQRGLGLDITKGGTEGRTVDDRGRRWVARERSAAIPYLILIATPDCWPSPTARLLARRRIPRDFPALIAGQLLCPTGSWTTLRRTLGVSLRAQRGSSGLTTPDAHSCPQDLGNLAAQRPPSSGHGCPDLSSLQITLPKSKADTDTVSSGTPNGSERETATGLSRAPSPDTLSPRSSSRKLSSTGNRASRKARSVLGRVRAFHRIAAARMAHSPVKIDTNVLSTKRGRPQEDSDDASESCPAVEQETCGPGVGGDDGLPPFLCQPYTEIHNKFEELEWLQRARLAEGLLAKDPSHRWALEADPEVKARNRYLNVQAWANSRIHLRVPEGECDFINASPIVLKDSSTEEETKYIATQGPKSGHLAHFWHMVFHESKEVAVIVMLTQTVEAGREKCAQYFPLDEENASMVLQVEETDPFINDEGHGRVNESMLGEITLLESTFDEESRSEIRKLELTMGSQSKIVWHFLFAGWADYSKPEGADREGLLKLIKQTASKSTLDNPRIVHCSAGVGRTGTFIALDHLLRELESGALLKVTDPDTDPVFETVNQLREQRMMMVYNEMQMQFIYEVLREQAALKLGKIQANGDDGTKRENVDVRSPKVAKLSSESDYKVPSKSELKPVPDRSSTPTRSWSGTPEVSDNE
ncbi:hypothetical protein VTN00DRAFT_1796 [Thermoascus crustaceus]|uniref:uncharacterized protein n=1 Tax=Thermoascus crustaceus TaxID=5088 RepID=UPI003742B578